MGRRIGRFIQIDDSIPDIVEKRPFEGRVSSRERGIVTSSHVELVVVLEKDGPFGGIQGRGERLRFDKEIGGGLLVTKGGEGEGVVGRDGLRVVLVLHGFALLLPVCGRHGNSREAGR